MRLNFVKFEIPKNVKCYMCHESLENPYIWHLQHESELEYIQLFAICTICYYEKNNDYWSKNENKKLATIKAQKLALIETQRQYYNWHTSRDLIKQHQEDKFYPWESLDYYIPLKEPKND